MWLIFNFILSHYYEKIIFRNKNKDFYEIINKIEKLLDINFFFFNGKLIYPRLENKIREIAVELLVVDKSLEIKKTNRVLHIGSVFHNTGGHSRVVLNWIKNDIERENHVLLTRQQENNEMIKSFDDDKIFFLNKEYDVVKKAQELVDFLSKNDYEFVILHNHWYDTIPFLALTLLPDQKVIFYNHTDNCATFGTSFSNLVLEVSPKAFFYSKKYRNISNSRYIPMPLSYLENEKNFKSSFTEDKSFLSIGSPYKYEPFERYNFYYDSHVLFKKFENLKLYLIGVDNRDIINLKNIDVKKIVFDPIEYYSKTQYYLESYPVGSGLAMLDAMSLGSIPIFNKRAITIHNQGSRWLFDENEIPDLLILNTLKERISLFDKINNNRIDTEQLKTQFKKVLSKHYNPLWQSKLNDIYKDFNFEKQYEKKKSKILYKFKVAKFCTVNNMTQYKEHWKYLLQHVYGIEYHALNSIYKLICKIKK